MANQGWIQATKETVTSALFILVADAAIQRLDGGLSLVKDPSILKRTVKDIQTNGLANLLMPRMKNGLSDQSYVFGQNLLQDEHVRAMLEVNGFKTASIPAIPTGRPFSGEFSSCNVLLKNGRIMTLRVPLTEPPRNDSTASAILIYLQDSFNTFKEFLDREIRPICNIPIDLVGKAYDMAVQYVLNASFGERLFLGSLLATTLLAGGVYFTGVAQPLFDTIQEPLLITPTAMDSETEADAGADETRDGESSADEDWQTAVGDESGSEEMGNESDAEAESDIGEMTGEDSENEKTYESWMEEKYQLVLEALAEENNVVNSLQSKLDDQEELTAESNGQIATKDIEIRNVQSQLSAKTTLLDTQAQQIRDLESQAKERTASIDDLSSRCKRKDEETESLKLEVSSLKEAARTDEQQIASLRSVASQAGELQEQVTALQSSAVTKDRTITTLTHKAEQKAESIRKLSNTFTKEQAKCAGLRVELSTSKYNNNVQSSRIIALQNGQSQLEANLSSLQKQHSSLKIGLKDLESANEELVKERSALLETEKELNEQIDSDTTAFDSKIDDIIQLKTVQATLEEEIRTLKKTNEQLGKENESLKNAAKSSKEDAQQQLDKSRLETKSIQKELDSSKTKTKEVRQKLNASKTRTKDLKVELREAENALLELQGLGNMDQSDAEEAEEDEDEAEESDEDECEEADEDDDEGIKPSDKGDDDEHDPANGAAGFGSGQDKNHEDDHGDQHPDGGDEGNDDGDDDDKGDDAPNRGAGKTARGSSTASEHTGADGLSECLRSPSDNAANGLSEYPRSPSDTAVDGLSEYPRSPSAHDAPAERKDTETQQDQPATTKPLTPFSSHSPSFPSISAVIISSPPKAPRVIRPIRGRKTAFPRGDHRNHAFAGLKFPDVPAKPSSDADASASPSPTSTAPDIDSAPLRSEDEHNQQPPTTDGLNAPRQSSSPPSASDGKPIVADSSELDNVSDKQKQDTPNEAIPPTPIPSSDTLHDDSNGNATNPSQCSPNVSAAEEPPLITDSPKTDDPIQGANESKPTKSTPPSPPSIANLQDSSTGDLTAPRHSTSNDSPPKKRVADDAAVQELHTTNGSMAPSPRPSTSLDVAPTQSQLNDSPPEEHPADDAALQDFDSTDGSMAPSPRLSTSPNVASFSQASSSAEQKTPQSAPDTFTSSNGSLVSKARPRSQSSPLLLPPATAQAPESDTESEGSDAGKITTPPTHGTTFQPFSCGSSDPPASEDPSFPACTKQPSSGPPSKFDYLDLVDAPLATRIGGMPSLDFGGKNKNEHALVSTDNVDSFAQTTTPCDHFFPPTTPVYTPIPTVLPSHLTSLAKYATDLLTFPLPPFDPSTVIPVQEMKKKKRTNPRPKWAHFETDGSWDKWNTFAQTKGLKGWCEGEVWDGKGVVWKAPGEERKDEGYLKGGFWDLYMREKNGRCVVLW